MARFRSCYHPALRCWQHLVLVPGDAVCRLCVQEFESVEYTWLRYPTLLVATTPLRPWPYDGRTRSPSMRCSSASEDHPQAPAETPTTTAAHT